MKYGRARAARERLQRIAQPPALDHVLAAERKRIEQRAADTTQFTEVERARLAQLAREKQSWNPLARSTALKAELELRNVHQSRYKAAVTEAMREFDKRDVPKITSRIAIDERRYRQYVSASLDLEGQMREARTTLRCLIPQVEQRINVLDSAGVSRLEGCNLNARLDDISAVVDRRYKTLPEPLRRDVERSMRLECRDRDRSRESISMGDR